MKLLLFYFKLPKIELLKGSDVLGEVYIVV